jgi:ribonuclease T2
MGHEFNFMSKLPLYSGKFFRSRRSILLPFGNISNKIATSIHLESSYPSCEHFSYGFHRVVSFIRRQGNQITPMRNPRGRTSKLGIFQYLILAGILLFVLIMAWEWWQGSRQVPQSTRGITPTVQSLISGKSITPGGSQNSGKASSSFDYYILALSWSPDYCASEGSSDIQQCSIGKKLGFVLHGLWPEYEQGYPANCTLEKLPADAKTRFPNLYPNDSLYVHEWEKHGTCTGLSAMDYLALSKKIKDSLVVPAEYKSPAEPFRTTSTKLKQQFSGSNPGLNTSSMAVYCSGSGRFLSELYVCYTTDAKATACSNEINKDAAKTCQAADFLVRNVR